MPVPTGCAVRDDPRAKAWFAETSPEGTACVFGADGDVRDEGSHCIFDDGAYGSNGWCYTSEDRSSWGSCNDKCPLYGPAKQLGKKIDHMDKMVDKVLTKLNTKSATDNTEKVNEDTENDAKKETPATTAAPKDAAAATTAAPAAEKNPPPAAPTNKKSE